MIEPIDDGDGAHSDHIDYHHYDTESEPEVMTTMRNIPDDQEEFDDHKYQIRGAKTANDIIDEDDDTEISKEYIGQMENDYYDDKISATESDKKHNDNESNHWSVVADDESEGDGSTVFINQNITHIDTDDDKLPIVDSEICNRIGQLYFVSQRLIYI